MTTLFYINVSWAVFCITFGAMLLVGFIMNWRSRHFYTLDVVIRKFSMTDLELPASSLELVTLIKGIFELPPELSGRSLRALKGNLYLDFLFMPLAYGSLFLFCMQLSVKLTSSVNWLFAVVAWLQVVPWICDIIENVYLLKKIRPDADRSKPSIYKAFQIIVIGKWCILLISAVFTISTVMYFWVSGIYLYSFIHYLLIILTEIFIIVALKLITSKSAKVDLEPYQDIGN